MFLRAAVLSLLLAAGEPAAPPAPLDVGVTEETGTALGQLDVTLLGKPEALAQVGPGSFQVWVGGRKLDHVIADGLCPAARPEGATPESPTATDEPKEVAPRRPATWIVYFDQPHLTLAGRARSIQLAREALPQILSPGDRAAIVSNARGLSTEQPMTEDLAALLAALDRLEKDQTQFDPYASGEESRVTDIMGGGPDAKKEPETIEDALALVQQYAEEERWRTQRDLSRLGMVIGRLADAEAPKSVLYFADITRRNPGDHYLSILSASVLAKASQATRSGSQTLEDRAALSLGGELGFDRVIRQAAALGIRFYTVEPQPLQDSATRVRDAQSTLQAMAAETGGRAFVNGVTPKRLVAGVREDRSCLWLLSFDPEGLPRDAALPVRVEVDVPKVKVQVRGQTVIQSAGKRVTNRLLAHFAVETEDQASPLRAAFVPLAWKEGKYSALLQVVAPATSLPMATWDLGASVVATEKVAAEASARTRVGSAGIPVALETVVELKPGPFELVAVAREVTSDKVLSSRQEGTWPHPDDALAEVVQPVVLQPSSGAFTRDGKVRKSGSLVHGPNDPLDPKHATALVALVCRSKMVKAPLQVSRVLVGDTPIEFPPLTLDLGAERCGQVRDMIPEKTLGPGRYRYQIVVKEKGAEIGRGEASFVVPEP